MLDNQITQEALDQMRARAELIRDLEIADATHEAEAKFEVFIAYLSQMSASIPAKMETPIGVSYVQTKPTNGMLPAFETPEDVDGMDRGSITEAVKRFIARATSTFEPDQVHASVVALIPEARRDAVVAALKRAAVRGEIRKTRSGSTRKPAQYVRAEQ